MSNQTFEQLFENGTRLLHQGQAQEALPLLKKAYDLQPEHADVAINLSGAYIMTKQFRKAVPILEALSEQEPDNAMVWTNLGAAYLGNPVLAQDEHHAKAIAAFEQALAVNPIAPHVAYNLGLIYRDRKELETAIYWFQQAIRANPADQDARSLLAKLEAEKEN
ncbi:MAG: tetratricopeptide repeat protein [Candidatus Promineifilaceae bacterium]